MKFGSAQPELERISSVKRSMFLLWCREKHEKIIPAPPAQGSQPTLPLSRAASSVVDVAPSGEEEASIGLDWSATLI